MRISEDARRCVVFFGVPTDRAAFQYGGTGFLASYDDPEARVRSHNLITCRHVAQALEQYSDTGFCIRLNTQDGASQEIPVTKIEWRYHPDPTVDLAVTTFGARMETFDQKYLDLNKSALFSKGHEMPNVIMAGDPINIVGLFRLHAGSKRNIPFVHSGHIAALPDPKERVRIRDTRTQKIIESEAYLIEAQTLDGLSGSPVFFHQMLGLARYPPTLQGNLAMVYGDVWLLGLYIGSWDGEPGAILAADRNLKGGTRVPVGMGMVVPSEKIIELLRDDEVMKKQRKDQREKLDRDNAANQDAAFGEIPASDANPNHREDFNSLLGEAVRKPAQED